VDTDRFLFLPGNLFMTCRCSGVILSGGLNTRMGGQSKAFLSVGGTRILDRLHQTMDSLFEDILLVTNAPLEYLSWDMMIVTDIISVRSSLTGIHAGLFHAPSDHVFVTACDMPFLKAVVVKALLGELEPKWDVIIPVTAEGYQPLCAVYSKRCIKPIEAHLASHHAKITDFFSTVRVKAVSEETIRTIDPDLNAFFNINTPEELATANRMVEKGL
jgi:molybdopterin-guanine dinucleotide biosynthesis protein A